MAIIQYSKEEIVDIRDKMGNNTRVPEYLEFPDEPDGSLCRWAIVHTVRRNPAEKREFPNANNGGMKHVRFHLLTEFPQPQPEDNTNTDLPSPSSSSSSSVDSTSGRLILDAIRGPKQHRKVKPGLTMPIPISIPVEVEGDLGSLLNNSSVKPKTTKQYLLNMDTGILEEIQPSVAKAPTPGVKPADIKLELEKIQRQLQPGAITQKNAEIKLELEKIQRPQKTEPVNKGGLKPSNTFSIFGINVGGVDLLRKRDPVNPGQKRSEPTEMNQDRFNFNSWVEAHPGLKTISANSGENLKEELS